MLKLGRKRTVHNRQTMRSALALFAALDPMGPPPLQPYDYVSAVDKETGGNWGMLGNADYGDCVPCMESHGLMLRTANAGQIVIPTVADTLGLYAAETGFNPSNPSTDQGTDETTDADFMVNTGLLGHRATNTAMVDPGNLDHIRWCIQLFGSCNFGVNLPKSAMDQFNMGAPWTVLANDGGILGGHAILAVYYHADGSIDIISWGKLVNVAADWLYKYLDEAHALLFADWISQNGASPASFSLNALLSDLSDISMSS